MNNQSSTPSSSALPGPVSQTKTWNEGYTGDSYTHATGPASQQPTSSKNGSQITVSDVLDTIHPGDILSVHQAPCSRQGFLTGIGGGAAVGGIRFIMGAPIPKAANWAVGVGILASIGQYEICQYLRRQEKIKMQRVVEVYSKAQVDARKKEAEERQRKAAEEAEAEAARQRKKSWYKFW